MSSQIYTNQRGLERHIKYFDINSIYHLAYTTGRNLAKRIFDFTVVLVSLILLVPVFLYIAILIKQDSPGPVFFWGSRMGKGGKPFKMLKFRTMYERPESYQGPRVTADGDDRITPLGHWLRDTKINELPQLWNVLKGDMSIVGPRPEDVEIARTWPNDAFNEILSIRPGITSPTSILYHDEEKLLSQDNLMPDYYKNILPDKIRLDRLYVRHHSFFSDLDAIFWTIAIIIPQISRTRIPEGYLFAGPISRLVNRYVNWFIVDFLVSIGVTYAASLMWVVDQAMDKQARFGMNYLPLIGSIIALLFSGFNSLIGLNRVLWSEATIDDAVRLTFSVICMTVVVWTLNYIEAAFHWLPIPLLPTNMILFIGAVSGFGFLVTRYRLRLLSSAAHRWVNWRRATSDVGERVLIVGLGEGTKIANYLFQQGTFRTAFSVVGTIDHINPSRHGMRVGGNWILGGIRDIPSIIKSHDVGLILSTIPHHDPENEYLLEICQVSRTRLIFLDDLLSMTDRQITRPQGQVDSPVWVDGHLEYKAMHDMTTGLPNRYLLQDRLQRSIAFAKRNNTQPILIFVEFEQIKRIEDSYGNKIAAQAVMNIVERLEKCKRESDTLARFGFNKFALLIDHVPSEQEVEIITKRISTAFVDPLDLGDRELRFIPDIRLCYCAVNAGDSDESRKVEITRLYGTASKINVEI